MNFCRDCDKKPEVVLPLVTIGYMESRRRAIQNWVRGDEGDFE